MQITDKSGHAYIFTENLCLHLFISLFCKDCYLHNCLIVNILNFQSHGIIDFFVRANIPKTAKYVNFGRVSKQNIAMFVHPTLS